MISCESAAGVVIQFQFYRWLMSNIGMTSETCSGYRYDGGIEPSLYCYFDASRLQYRGIVKTVDQITHNGFRMHIVL